MHTRQSSLLPSTPLQTLLDGIRAQSRSETDKGSAFEDLCVRYLKNEPEYQALYREVQPYKDWATRHGQALGLTANDKGIDLVATTHTDEHVAVQCKCYAPDHIVAKPDIDSFLSASGHKAFSARILIDTTLKAYGANAEEMLQHQHIPVMRIDLQKLETSLIDWSQYKLAQATAPLFDRAENAAPEIPLKPKHAPHPYQQTAIDDVINSLQTADRGKLIMACGTGKTFTSLKIAEAQAGKGKTVLFLVPSLALLSQTLTEWSQQSQTPIIAFAVCSDSEVGKQRNSQDDDSIHMALHELAYPATTDAVKLAQEYAARHVDHAMTVVFSTYHSIDVLHAAQQQGLPAFDLAICDEAHRTTGIQFEGEDESAFVRIHDNAFIAAHKRLYMTATPRIYGPDESKRQQTAQKTAELFVSNATETLKQLASSVLYSMDDEALYGQDLHRLSFSEAVKQNLLVPYKIVMLTVDEQDVGERLQELLNDGNNNLQVGDAARIVGCYKALAKTGEDWPEENQDGQTRPIMQRAVAFCQIIGQDRQGKLVNPGKKIAARQIATQFKLVTDAYQKNPKDGEPTGIEFAADFIHGGMDASEKTAKLNWLKARTEPNHCRVLTNVRCLSEGVDVPALDAVIFLSPRQSQVDVVQSVGRVMRKSPGKERGYIILPVVIPWGMTPAEAMRDNKPWQTVWKTLAALKAHDDEGFGRMIDRAELVGNDPEHFQILIDPATVRRAQAPGEAQQVQHALNETRTRYGIGNDVGEATAPYQHTLNVTTGALEQAIRAKVVKKMADPSYWDRWTGGIARIAQMQIDRIRAILQNPANTTTRAAFDAFATQLRQHINSSIDDEDIIEMVAQHLITGPVFDALFGSAQFSQKNPISADLQAVADILCQDFHLDKEHQQLQGFYEQVRRQAADIASPAARQKLLIRLYDDFFASAFPRVVQKHGIVYTPIEIVDFILHSVAYLLQTQFGKTLSDDDVQLLDPFTGTGTFIARLLASNLIDPAKRPQVYQNGLHATEILLLPYYIAAVNIESTFAQAHPELPYTPFPGILLADTFNIPTEPSEDWVTAQEHEALAANNARRKRQMDSKITVIVGNPPYSVGQKSQNDNNQNVSYEELDRRIQTTYVAGTKATNKNALYDSYIRAIRWASDRIDKNTGGIIGFVTNAGWLDSAATAGLRQCLREEFSSLYVFHLRGNQRTQGEQSRKEGGKVFGSGSRAPIAISILVKTPQHDGKTSDIYFCDIGDYLNREEKLQKIAEFTSIGGIEKANLWQRIEPDGHGDWLNQRQGDFAALLPMGDAKNKNKTTNTGMFVNFSRGSETGRDPWCNNPSRAALLENIRRLVNFYETQRSAFRENYPDTQQRQKNVDRFIDNDPTKISWTRGLKADLARDKELKFNSRAAVQTLYRPFSKGWLYYDRNVNAYVNQMPQIFPLPAVAEQSRAEQSRAEQSRAEQLYIGIIPEPAEKPDNRQKGKPHDMRTRYRLTQFFRADDRPNPLAGLHRKRSMLSPPPLRRTGTPKRRHYRRHAETIPEPLPNPKNQQRPDF